MSGIEVAGLILGGFPLLISAAEHYKEGFEPLVKWKRFRTEFIAFIDAVDIEKQLFDNTMERFLMGAGIPQDELQAFMTKPGYEGWEREDIAKLLQSRLGPTYPAYISTIKTMNELMEDLKTFLLLKNGKVDWAKDGESRWDYQMKRIHLSFSKKGARTLLALETHNRKLRELLDSNDKLDGMRAARKDTAWASIFECIRNHASNLHTALKNSWACDCMAPHNTALRLQKRVTGGWTSQFHMDFPTPSRTSSTRREVVITVKEKAQRIVPLPSPEPDGYLLELRQNFELKSTHLATMSSRPSLRPPSPSESTITSSSSTTSSRASFKGLFSMRSESFSSTTTISSSNGTQSILSKRTVKPKKSVRITSPVEVAVEPSVSIAPPIESVVEAKIDDLCSTLQHGTDCSCLGYVLDNENRQYELRLLKEEAQFAAARDAYDMISLETLLRGRGEMRLNRQQRYRIASILASSLLQLQNTPWLAEKMDKKNIFFFKQGSKIVVDQPYINHSFISTKVTSLPNEASNIPAARRFAVRKSLNYLGIILLELCFGQAIEDQELRKDHLDPDGKAHKDTDYLTAIDWSDLVREEDPELEPIIKCCVFSAFQEKADWDSKPFVQAVYASVVEPLEKSIGKWAN